MCLFGVSRLSGKRLHPHVLGEGSGKRFGLIATFRRGLMLGAHLAGWIDTCFCLCSSGEKLYRSPALLVLPYVQCAGPLVGGIRRF
jgi:hypothetical protein